MKEFIDLIKFDDKGLVPVITQEYKTDEILMLAYMNLEAVTLTVETGKAHYWSRSRNKLWQKGETSGNFQKVKSIAVDCDGDTLLIKVKQTGVACHTGNYSCFFRKFDINKLNEKEIKKAAEVIKSEEGIPSANSELSDDELKNVLKDLYNIILDRKINPKEGSYTNYLFDKGMDKILKKIGEETSEVIIAGKNMSNDEIGSEFADLFYHICVLLVERGIELEEIYKELRHRSKG